MSHSELPSTHDPRIAGAEAAARIGAVHGTRARYVGGPMKALGLMLRSNGGIIGLTILVFFTVIAIIGPWIAPEDPNSAAAFSSDILAPPSAEHLLGTDDNGRDVLSQLILGTQISMLVGFCAALVSAVVGTIVGITAGYFGGWTDRTLTAVDDWFLVLPYIPTMVVLATLLGDRAEDWPLGRVSVMILAIGFLGWAGTSRIVRSEVLSVKERPFVERARALGASNGWIMRRQILPNVLPLVFANTVLFIALSILTESLLSFLGLGDPTHFSWGQILASANSAGAAANGQWWYFGPPGICITLVVVGFSLVGYAIEEIVNPKLRTRR
jgi:peptide/nickel transport system permease protein